MADKPIGTMFVELDLDASRYTKGQQKLLKDAQSTSLNIEQNFKNLGIKSSAEMDLMRAKIKNSFDMIANNSKSSANDIVRAERAKNEQLEALNRKQYGEQVNLIESVKTKWVGMAAGAAAAIYATARTIGQAIEMTATGSKLEKQAAAFENLSRAAGTSAAQMIKDLRKMSGEVVTDAELISASGKSMLMGIQPGEITRLMEIAAATSRSTGQTITEAFNDITMGVARQSKMILDNLGIMVDVDRANRDYAASLGKTSDALTDAEKRQAFMNSVMKSGEDMIKRIGSSAGSLDNVNKLIAASSNLWDGVNKTVAAFLDNELGAYIKAINWIDEKLKGMRTARGDATKSDLWKEVEMLRSLEAKGMSNPGLAADKEAEYNRRYLQPQYGMRSSEELKRTGSFSTPAWNSASWREREGQWVDYTEAEKKAMVDARDKALKDIAQTKPAKSIWEGWGVRPYTESEAFMADEKAWLDYKKNWSDYKQRLPESQQSEAMLADQKAWDDWKKSGEHSMNYLSELSEHTAERMQDNFSEFFFDAFRGELKSLEDYAQSVFDSLLRAAADMSGQMMTQAIFGAKSVGGTQGGGGLIGWIGSLFAASATTAASASGNAFGAHGIERFAAGGIVTRPTVFPFARGIGLMGEAGPEGILPLKRNAAGRLGVEASGGGSPSVYMPITIVAPDGRMSRESLSQTGHAAYMGLRRAWGKNA